MRRNALRFVLLGFLVVCVSPGLAQVPTNSVAQRDSRKWEKDIAAFEASDRTNPPPKGCIVFVGSSSIRFWSSLKTDFPGLPVVNRGFGGSELADSVHFADRIIFPYEPREVIVYAGANDLANGKSPQIVFGDFVALFRSIHERLPNARVVLIATAPNPSRWANVENMRKFNSLAQDYCQQHGAIFVDVFSLMLGPDGQPKPDIFRDDRLHMNAKGYAIWKEALAPYVR
ncbi:MAG TPA: SGNH/GDSL hydrolase family protein [Verrucomicrobiae bacterium]|nr:SGNH/GDSL hydrolase family protein [Verrucomicrobiae bacterium]